MAKLTNKQKLFCETYVSNGLNATQAAISAGYKKSSAKETGYENLTKPHIAQYIKELQAETSQKLVITRESQLKELNELKDMAKDLQEVNNAIKAIEVQNKMLGLNEPEKISLEGHVETVVKFADR